MAGQSLRARLRRVRRRLLVIGSSSAAAWGFQAARVLLLAAAWLDLLWELSAAWRVAALSAAGFVAVVGVFALVWRTGRLGRNAVLARRLDQAGATGGQILTGLELDQRPRATGIMPVPPIAT